MADRIADLRQEYEGPTLRKEEAHPNPFVQFEQWFAEAHAKEDVEANAMTLATATADGLPSARIVLLKGIENEQFVFYTNYASIKGQQMAANPHAALVFWWPKLARQVRIEGTISKVDEHTSTAYFQSRPRGSQLGAWASAQSEEVADRDALETSLDNVTARFANTDPIPRPSYWGGYQLAATVIEFWQGRPNRLHDRVAYTQNESGEWQQVRLAP